MPAEAARVAKWGTQSGSRLAAGTILPTAPWLEAGIKQGSG